MLSLSLSLMRKDEQARLLVRVDIFGSNGRNVVVLLSKDESGDLANLGRDGGREEQDLTGCDLAIGQEGNDLVESRSEACAVVKLEAKDKGVDAPWSSMRSASSRTNVRS